MSKCVIGGLWRETGRREEGIFIDVTLDSGLRRAITAKILIDVIRHPVRITHY
jgi:hypothetical protein